jgi:hypothetical protein
LIDEGNALNQIVSAIIQRHMKSIHAYEIEIANMMAEIIRLKSSLSEEKSSN